MRFSSCDTIRRASTTATFGGLFFCGLISWLRSDCQLTIELMVCFRRVFFFELLNKIAHSGIKELCKLF